MKKACIALLIATMGISASAQFFSKEEKAAKEKDKQAELKSNLPETEQMQIYLEICDAERRAEIKAVQMYPVKIHQTPEVREEQIKRAEQTAESLMNLYKEEIAKEHQISAGYLGEIQAAGKKKQWPDGAPAASQE